jgi:hypothetical protein
MSAPDRTVHLRRARRSFIAHAVIAGILGVLCLPTGTSLALGWPFADTTSDLPPGAYPGMAVAVLGATLGMLTLVAAAMLGRSALGTAIASGGPVDAGRAAAARRVCAIATALGLGGYGVGIVIGVINSLAGNDLLPAWGAFTSGTLVTLALLIVRRGLARDLRWLTRA